MALNGATKILLFGGSGQIGHAIRQVMSDKAVLIVPDRTACDFTNLTSLEQTLNNINPDIIINAAAYTQVDAAETHAVLARQVNTTAPALLARYAAEKNIRLIHYSTDYVFNGEGNEPWQESDTPAPFNTYGQTKYEADIAIMNSGCHYLILRSSWIYGHGENFISKIQAKARANEKLRVISNQIGAPTSAEFLAQATLTALQSEIEGLYHVAARGETSWYDYARFILPEYTNIEPILDTDLNLPARRPRNSRLNTEKFERVFGITPPLWQDDVRRYLKGSKA